MLTHRPVGTSIPDDHVFAPIFLATTIVVDLEWRKNWCRVLTYIVCQRTVGLDVYTKSIVIAFFIIIVPRNSFYPIETHINYLLIIG